MQRFALVSLSLTFLFLLSTTGCQGGGEPTVVEAPAEPSGEEQPAMEGMTDEEYDKAMEEDMGN